MKVLSSKTDISSIYTKVGKLIQVNKNLPDNVFTSTSKNFLFITFDDLRMSVFFNHIRQFLLVTGESEFWLVPVNIASKQGSESSFDIDAAVQFSVADSEEDFLHTVNGTSDDIPASIPIYVADLLIAFSSRSDWVIFGDRKTDLAVCAISNSNSLDIFSSIYGSDLLNGIEAEEHAFGVSLYEPLKEKFRQNYSFHTPVHNVTPIRKEYECNELPVIFDVKDGPKEFEKNLNELAIGSLAKLMQCSKCKQFWLIDKLEQCQEQLAIKLEVHEGWEEIDTTQLRKDFLLESRGGITEEECMWARCSKSRVKGVAYCLDHLYETGTKK